MRISQLIPDQRNANRGTDRGRKMVRESLKRYGAGRSILLDKAGNVIAGNKTLAAATAVGMEDVQIVKTDGTKLVAVAAHRPRYQFQESARAGHRRQPGIRSGA